MDLSAFKKKLGRLTGEAAPSVAAPPGLEAAPDLEGSAVLDPSDPSDVELARRARIAKLRTLLGEMEGRHRAKLRHAPKPAITPVALPGELIETAYGPLHRRRLYLEPHHAHGEIPIARSLVVSGKTIAGLALDPTLEGIDPRRALYLDTETTGLSGGTGTLPFLVGLAYFEDESLVIEQLLLRRPGEEKPLLHALRERMEAASAIVTYNGKSFDWPLLRTRAVMNRVPLPAPAMHLDLLHCARRVLGPRLEKDAGGVRLVQVESEVLGMRRLADIDGAEIPERFWAFVRGADASQLVPVIEHNANDLVALAAILVALAERWDAVLPSHAPEDVLGVAKTALRAGDDARALKWASAASAAGGGDALACEALRLCATVHKRNADPHAAVAAIERALPLASPALRPRLHLELSKLLEHRLRDYAGALVSAHLARAAEPEDANTRRIARIEKKRSKRAAA